jgi:hypothetical protein
MNKVSDYREVEAANQAAFAAGLPARFIRIARDFVLQTWTEKLPTETQP